MTTDHSEAQWGHIPKGRPDDRAQRDPDARRRKRAWRKALLAGRKARIAAGASQPHRDSLTAELDHLIGVDIRPGDVVATYVPIGSEPDVSPFTQILLDKGATVLVPDLSVAPDGSRIPFRQLGQTAGAPPAQIDKIKAVIVPSLALDSEGTRLGRGAGWYDRALRRFTSEEAGNLQRPALVGVCHDEEFYEQERLPSEGHDLPLDYVVTGSRTLKTASNK